MFPQVFGKYILERPLAAGGMAHVYLATLRGAGGFEKRLVVKQIRAELATDEAFVRRFVAEAKTTVELSHPNIVPVYELGVEQGVYFLAMELCDGVTLAELLERGGPLGVEEGAYVAIEICRALDYAHRKASVVHRDVTPRNVIIDEEGGVRLIDFGIAAKAHTGAREVFGSPGHMPPEQLRGEAVGPAADVFAVAALLIEAWSGLAPFRRGDAHASARALGEPVRAPSELAPHLVAVAALDAHVLGALAPRAAARPQTAEDFARPLRRFLAEHDMGDVARELAERVRRVRREHVDTDPPTRDDRPMPTGQLRAVPESTCTFALRRTAAGPSTPATRRIGEDPQTWSSGPPPRRARAPRARFWVPGVALLAVAGVTRLVAERRSDAPTSAPLVSARPVAASRAVLAEPPSLQVSAATPAPSMPSAASPTTASPTTASPTEPPSPPPPPGLTATSARPDHPGLEAHLQILTDPPALLEIDGRPRGTAPVRDVALAPGRHVVRLYCAALDESLTEPVTLAPGEAVTISADFTAARGRLIVRRATR